MSKASLAEQIAEIKAQQPTDIPIGLLISSPVNERGAKKDGDWINKITELANSIKAQGLLSPIIARPIPEGENKDKIEIVCGERRYRAFVMLGLKTIPGFVKNLTDKEAHEITVCENLQREDPTPLEESAGINVLINDGQSIDEISDRMGKPLKWVARRSKLVNLSEKWLKKLSKPEFASWSANHMELIARLDKEAQDALLEEKSYWNPHASLKELQLDLDKYQKNLSSAPWDPSADELLQGVCACTSCQKRTGCEPLLFDIPGKKGAVDKCLDAACWNNKAVAFLKTRIAAAKAENPDVVLINDSYDEVVPASELGAPSVDRWSVTECKKTDKGAKLAVIIGGGNLGKEKWVTSNRSGGDLKTVAGPKSMKEKRAGLEKRRAISFIGKIVALLEALFKTPKGTQKVQPSLVSLVAAFGASPLKTHDAMDYGHQPFKAKAPADSETVVLLRCVLPKIITELRGEMNGNTVESKNAEAACAWFGFDAKKIIEQVRKEIPVPKAWGAQVVPEKPAAKKNKKQG